MASAPSGGGGGGGASIAKTNLSHILPTSAACHILGEDIVRLVVRSFLRHVASSASAGRGLAGSGAGASSRSLGGAGANQGGSGGGTAGGSSGGASASFNNSIGGSQSSVASSANTMEQDPYAGLDDPAVPFPYHLFAESTYQPREAAEETEWINAVGRALFYDFESRRGGDAVGGAGMGSGDELLGTGSHQVPREVMSVWARLTKISSSSALGLDKTTALSLGVLVPYSSLPQSGAGGHFALFECMFHALAASPSSGNGGRGGAGGGGGSAAADAVQSLKSRVEEQMMGGAATAARVRSVLLLPDLIIFFAICRKYRLEATTPQLSKSEGRRYATLLASLLAFRVYDGYQKKGLVSRDTIHRFFADVHGDESYHRAGVRRVLDALFTVEELTPSGPPGAHGGPDGGRQLRDKPHLTPAEFCRGVSTTTTLNPATGYQSHVLLDWILTLGNATLPDNLMPSPSMYRLIRDKMDLLAVANPDRAIGGLCKKYGLGQGDLYEVKRRFRSVVELVPESDESDTSLFAGGGDSGSFDKEEGHNLPLEEDPSSTAAAAATSHAATGRPRNVIRKAAFIKAASEPDETDGQGGYLTTALAELTFVGGWIMGNRRRRGDEEDKYWTMTDVLSFGCRAVRGDALDPDPEGADAGLLKFVYATFLMLPRSRDGSLESDDEDEDASDVLSESGASTSTSGDRSSLNRAQIGHMILHLIEHSAFRLTTDSPPPEDDDSEGKADEGQEDEEDKEEEESSDEEEFDSDYSDEEEFDSGEEGESGRSLAREKSEHIVVDETKIKTVDVTAASLLGMLPPNIDSSETTADGRVQLDLLIDYVLDESSPSLPTNASDVGDESQRRRPTALSYGGFLNWYHSTSSSSAHLPKSDRRCGPYMLDLRLLGSILFGVRPTRPSVELSLVEEVQRRHKYRYPHMGKNLRGPPGTIWFVIQVGWWRKWLDYTQGKGGITASRLGRINNNVLLAENGSLAMNSGLRWKYDFELIPPLAWSALQAWHDGGPPIHRTVVTYPAPASSTKSPARSAKADDARALAEALLGTGSATKKKKEKLEDGQHDIELYPLFVSVMLCDATSGGEPTPFQQQVPLSRQKPCRSLLEELCENLETDQKNCRLWMRGKDIATAMVGPDGTPLLDEDAAPPPDFLLYLDMKLEDQLKRKGIVLGEGTNVKLTLIMEIKDEKDGSWPLGMRHNLDIVARALQQQKDESGIGDGIVGLYNMGNTCYLNSSLQCLSHTPILRDYFTTKAYLNDINAENPLGQQGRLAQVSAVLVNELWKKHGQSSPIPAPKKAIAPGSYNPVLAPALTPKSFKDAIGKFNEHFSGNEQHDAQELLAFLLGGLSEDLNRIHDKPYIEAPDSDGRPDKELADIWWSNHLKREMSIIVALFTGQYKSLLACRTCGYESARFEPFSFLTVPLPEDDQVSVQLVFCPLANTDERQKYIVRVKHDGTLFDVLISLAKILYADKHEEFGALEGEGIKKKNSKEGDDDASSAADEEDKLQAVYSDMAKNMAIVRMKESYVLNIVPNNWSLAKMQNRDTGELDVIYIYELDPLPKAEDSLTAKQGGKYPIAAPEDSDKEPSTASETGEESEAVRQEKTDEQPPEPAIAEIKTSYLAIAQRKLELGARPFLHPCAQCLFGVPLLVRVADLEGYTGRDLYDLVAERVDKYVPKTIHATLRRGAGLASDEEKASDADGGSPGRIRKPRGRQQRKQVMADMEEASAGRMPRYGFRLRLASRDGRRCALCPWYENCIGCHVPDDDSPTIVSCGDSITIDWHLALDLKTEGFGAKIADATLPIPGQRSNSANDMLTSVKKHKTCTSGKNKYGYGGCITLEECLDAFSEEEKIPEAYCSKCTEFRVQTKNMSLWRLPPVMIIHLKRFQFTQHMRRKLRDLVVFPTEGLDFTRIITSESADDKDCVTENGNGKEEEEEEEDPAPDENGEATSTNDDEEATEPSGLETGIGSMHLSTESESLYDLYGVIHHQGALSGGHYVASLKSETDGKWRLFNDAQIFEVSARDVVDSSAYILFYIRRDVQKAALDDFWDTTVREGQGMSQEEMDRLMKQREKCVIS